jgi:hypothetical protein
MRASASAPDAAAREWLLMRVHIPSSGSRCWRPYGPKTPKAPGGASGRTEPDLVVRVLRCERRVRCW